MTSDSTAVVGTLRRSIATLGRSLGTDVRDATQGLYAPLHPSIPPQRVLRNLSYGAHERQVLDLHLPVSAADSLRPVLVFVHGGGFVGGDKGGPDRPLHDNIGRFAVENGFIGATINYRFAPEYTYPSGGEDVATAVAFLANTVAAHGGDPQRIVAMGHSAGAAHVATCVASEDLALRATGLRGAVLSSGIYDPAALWGGVSTSYYGEDESAWPRMASRGGLAKTSLPLMLIVARYDPPDFHRQAALVVAEYVEERHELPELVIGRGHNHFSSPAHYGTVDDELSTQVARFVTEITRSNQE